MEFTWKKTARATLSLFNNLAMLLRRTHAHGNISPGIFDAFFFHSSDNNLCEQPLEKDLGSAGCAI
jgi:hypothetical protein